MMPIAQARLNTFRRTSVRRGNDRLRTGSEGFSLVEVMMASFVLVLAIVGAITTLQRGFQALDTARSYNYASQVMQSELERLRLFSWNQLQTLQTSGNTTVDTTPVPGSTAPGFSCIRSIRDLRTGMKEITLTATWSGHDGRSHNARFITRYSQNGLYDYFYTAH